MDSTYSPRDIIVSVLFKSVLDGVFTPSDTMLLHSMFTKNNSIKENLFSYFDNVQHPFSKIKNLIGFSLNRNLEDDASLLNGIRAFDKRGILFIERYYISDETLLLLNSACALHMIGADSMADDVARVAGRTILLDAFKSLVEESEFAKRISEMNRAHATGSKKEFHAYAVSIMKNTWSKYPTASKNGMAEKISNHFGADKVSKVTVLRWIKKEGLGPSEEVRPPISFSLVI